jgi:hypothetical protein
VQVNVWAPNGHLKQAKAQAQAEVTNAPDVGRALAAGGPTWREVACCLGSAPQAGLPKPPDFEAFGHGLGTGKVTFGSSERRHVNDETQAEPRIIHWEYKARNARGSRGCTPASGRVLVSCVTSGYPGVGWSSAADRS